MSKIETSEIVENYAVYGNYAHLAIALRRLEKSEMNVLPLWDGKKETISFFLESLGNEEGGVVAFRGYDRNSNGVTTVLVDLNTGNIVGDGLMDAWNFYLSSKHINEEAFDSIFENTVTETNKELHINYLLDALKKI